MPNSPIAELNSSGRQRQQPGRDGRSRPGRNRHGAGGAGRYRPDPAHARATIEGAFAQLKADTNAVAEKLTEIVGQLQEHLAARSRPRPAKSCRAPMTFPNAPPSRRRPSRRPRRRWSSWPPPCCENAERAKDASARRQSVSPAPPKRAAQVMAQANRGDGADHRVLGQDLQHHRPDRRHRLPDQPAGAQRLGRSGAGRRCRQGLCRGGRRSAAPGAVGGQASIGGQGADRAVGAPKCKGGSQAGRRSRRASSRPCWRRRARTTS